MLHSGRNECDNIVYIAATCFGVIYAIFMVALHQNVKLTKVLYRVSINSFRHYKHLLQENYVE